MPICTGICGGQNQTSYAREVLSHQPIILKFLFLFTHNVREVLRLNFTVKLSTHSGVSNFESMHNYYYLGACRTIYMYMYGTYTYRISTHADLIGCHILLSRFEIHVVHVHVSACPVVGLLRES